MKFLTDKVFNWWSQILEKCEFCCIYSLFAKSAASSFETDSLYFCCAENILTLLYYNWPKYMYKNQNLPQCYNLAQSNAFKRVRNVLLFTIWFKHINMTIKDSWIIHSYTVLYDECENMLLSVFLLYYTRKKKFRGKQHVGIPQGTEDEQSPICRNSAGGSLLSVWAE